METKEQKSSQYYPSHVEDAIKAANRSAKKLRQHKKALGQKLVVWENGKVVVIDP